MNQKILYYLVNLKWKVTKYDDIYQKKYSFIILEFMNEPKNIVLFSKFEMEFCN